MTRLLGQEGAEPRVSGMFFKALVQTVLLFGSDVWALIPCIDRSLGSFQNRVARWITRSNIRRKLDGVWEYPMMASAIEETGFEDIGVYIQKRQNTVAQYILTRLVMDLC